MKRRNPGATARATSTTTTVAENHSTAGCHDVAAWRRRREAAWRSMPLACGCRDPWTCRCRQVPLSENMVDAGAAATRHILDAGFLPLLDSDVLRELWRRGGEDRVLAEKLYMAGGAVA